MFSYVNITKTIEDFYERWVNRFTTDKNLITINGGVSYEHFNNLSPSR